MGLDEFSSATVVSWRALLGGATTMGTAAAAAASAATQGTVSAAAAAALVMASDQQVRTGKGSDHACIRAIHSSAGLD